MVGLGALLTGLVFQTKISDILGQLLPFFGKCGSRLFNQVRHYINSRLTTACCEDPASTLFFSFFFLNTSGEKNEFFEKVGEI